MNIQKNIWHSILFLSIALLLLISAGCVSFRKYTTYVYSPIYMPLIKYLNSFAVTKSKRLQKPGKIYFKDNFIFINEMLKGIHIIDNRNPKKPINKAFLSIPGNLDLAIKGNILYADSITDLLVIDLSPLKTNPLGIKIVYRKRKVFPYDPVKSMGLASLSRWSGTKRYFESIDHSKGIVVGWKRVPFTKARAKLQCCAMGPRIGGRASMGKSFSASSGAGVGGSLARFTIYRNFLYTIDSQRLKTFTIKNSKKPVLLSSTNIGTYIETIFPYKNKLFIGSESGMYVYDISQMPYKPQKITVVRHINMRDPVVVEGNYAFVTLRNNRGGLLMIYNIKNLSRPFLIKIIRMRRPHGLGIDDGRLFICDYNGIVVLDAAKIIQLSDRNRRWDTYQKYIISKLPLKMPAYDVIPFRTKLFVIGAGGFFQYDYSNIKNITLLSHILVFPERNQ